MLFNSFSFLLGFLPLVLAVALKLRGQRLLGWVVVSSFVFYAFAGHVWFLVPMLFTTVLDFFLAPLVFAARTPESRKRYLLLSVVCNLGLLAYFKYSALLVHTVIDARSLFVPGVSSLGWLEIFNVVLPAGISFYTFQTLSYMIDVYRGHCEPERNFLKFAGFVSFFPHLVAGPLTRHNQLIPSLENIAEHGILPRWREGTFLFSVGLCKKVLVADRIAALVDPLLAGRHLSFVEGWVALLGYSLQIYFDFSGYSDMAIGLGRLFGVELPQNFNSPYQALNPSDFWRRWHISLSQWLRDYLYISLGGNRCSESRRQFNLVATMVLGGLWHGASWTFAIWGLFHGLLLVLFHMIDSKWKLLPHVIQKGATFLLVCFGWVFFRSTSFSQAVDWFGALVGVHGFEIGAGRAVVLKLSALIAVGLLIVNAFSNASSYKSFNELGRSRQLVLGMCTAVAILAMNLSSKFLYFQF